MDDIGEKLAELLNDPESLNRVRDMAENILGNTEKKQSEAQADDGTAFGFDNIDIDPSQMAKILSVMSRLKNARDDNRSKLLLALKPHLSEPRREKVDAAIKLLKLIDLLPLLKGSGMFDL